MRERTLFDVAEPEATPIARASDPVTSHKAAAKMEPVITAMHALVFSVLKKAGQPMNSAELAKACCDEYCSELVSEPVLYAKRLNNYRKRADEIKRNPEMTVRLGTERDGGELFEARKP